MGFGLLFLGYIATFLMSLNSFGFAFRLTGCAIMFSGLSKLSEYETRFFYAKISVFLMTLSALAECIVTLILDYSTASVTFLNDNTKNICLTVFFAMAVLFHVLLYRSVYKISKDVGTQKITVSTVRAAVFSGIELIIILAAIVMWYVNAEIAKYIVMAAMLYPFLLFVINLVLIYSCYKNICEEGDEEAPRKPSRIPFLNKLFDAAEKREQEIYDKTKSYAEGRIKQDIEQKKRKKKKRK